MSIFQIANVMSQLRCFWEKAEVFSISMEWIAYSYYQWQVSYSKMPFIICPKKTLSLTSLKLGYNHPFPTTFFQIKTKIPNHFSPLLPVSMHIIIVQCLWKAIRMCLLTLAHDSLAALHSLPLFFLPRYFANDCNLFQGKLEIPNGTALS